ncbi:MAG: hypothetical protein KKH74_09950 [Gammaproteobacteria bacterium]|nr:hypothetical protein [Gammaproteobacteria bacterium]MBU1731252.1 hypothetical protein [Gammaproteobacteria bacterium]MBU1892757.1 hypothetical protein [Gammaproteobacteria bacterium]
MVGKILLAMLLSLFSCLACGDQSLPGGNAGQDIEEWFHTIALMAPARLAELDGRLFSFAVDLDNSPGFSMDFDAESGTLALLYRMAFNDVAEGWSWEPLANPDSDDYYRSKFLPLKSTRKEMAAPAEVEIYPGKRLEVRNEWRYDYFLAFENLYDFYPRAVDDDAGFGTRVKAIGLPARERLKMLAVFRLKAPFHSESNTFWKADFADPVDLTLRKRYLMGQLEEIRFVDGETGQVYARQLPMPTSLSPLPSNKPGGELH